MSHTSIAPTTDQLADLEEESTGELMKQTVQDLAIMRDSGNEKADFMAVVVGDGHLLLFLD
ncbi:MAG: hypothetical protein ACI9DF_002060 [Verrucomicrobiales bacterium]